MKIMIVDAVWPSFLERFYSSNPELLKLDYSAGWRRFMDERVGQADFYSSNLLKLGHEAREILFNNHVLQRQWAFEHGILHQSFRSIRLQAFDLLLETSRKLRKQCTGWAARVLSTLREPVKRTIFGESGLDIMPFQILEAQIKHFRPDVLFVHAVHQLPGSFLSLVKPKVRLIVGQHASPIPDDFPGKCYDLMLSSLPNLVAEFRSRGMESQLFRWGFESSLAYSEKPAERTRPVTFVGGYSQMHANAWEVFESVASRTPIEFWGYGRESLPTSSRLLNSHHGEAWGRAMYRLLAESKITLNRHIGIAGKHANNMRLYEATGMGALLLTDHKSDLHEMFEPDREIVSYSDADDCLKKIQYYLGHESERLKIAEAGQKKTMKVHNYRCRMEELHEILSRRLR
jgi:spore maturation protein CgeB